MLCKAISAAVFAVLAAVLPASGEIWNRFEPVGGFVGNGVYGGDILSVGIYDPAYGFGAGTKLVEARGETWDLPRQREQFIIADLPESLNKESKFVLVERLIKEGIARPLVYRNDASTHYNRTAAV
jgi:hypothetical protein